MNSQQKYNSKATESNMTDSTIEIVQEKFRRGESVLSLLETYQIIGSETPNRLLALVTSNGTYAVFSFAVACLPPKSFSDLTIDNIFPMNDSFELVADCKGKIAKFQFDIVSSCGRSVFYYYPYSSTSLNDFNSFHTHVISALMNYKYKKDELALSTDHRPNTTLSFSWLKAYKREDFIAIDRFIADGSKPLKKGESKFQDELKKHEHEYIVYRNYRVYCATWNINGQPCWEQSLKAWLCASEDPPDIYAVALQELDLSPKAITFSESRPDPIWIRKIMDSLHPGATYEELVSVRLVGMMLTIIVRREFRPNVTRYAIQTVGTGALNFMGNKGGVGVSMTLNEADICFVNSHLAAHVSEVERRNEDFAEIMKRLVFDETSYRRTIESHDHIFWIGDLNYRIIENPHQMLDYDNYSQLLMYDQLRSQMLARNVFEGFTEGEIKFRPTYKYDPGTDNWDSSEKCRAPAWCDRILWKGERIEQKSYDSVMEIRLSDHKPVYAVFLTGIKTKDELKYKRVHEEVLKRVDKYENDNQPQITVENTDVDFDIINFNEQLVRDFTVANNCHLPVKFSFKAKNGSNKKICEDWLDIEPKEGNLITGTSLSIRIKLLVDAHSVYQLHQKQFGHDGKIPLDILVLHVEEGRDIFITIMGEYKASCFGFSADCLCRTDRPISQYTLNELIDIENADEKFVCKVTMPREVFLLIDYLYNSGKGVLGLFPPDRKFSKNPNINQIRDWLDNWSTEEFPGTPHTAAEALLMLLESPKEPLLYPFTDLLLKTETFDQCLPILHQLTTPKKNVFLHICMFLRDGIDQRIFNSNEIATIFGRVLLKGRHFVGYRDDRCRIFMARFLRADFASFARTQIVVN